MYDSDVCVNKIIFDSTKWLIVLSATQLSRGHFIS